MSRAVAIAAAVASSVAAGAASDPLAGGARGNAAPARHEAQYTPLYFDDFEALAPSLSAGFALDGAGAITSSQGEVIAGSRSIRGSHGGAGAFTPYLRTRPSVVPFTPGDTYTLTFRYRILVAPSAGFEVLFFSPAGAASGSFLPSVNIAGAAGETGTAVLTNALGPYSDYEARWNVVGTGAVSVDEIVITRVASGLAVATENAEGLAPAPGAGLKLTNGAAVLSSPALAGQASVDLRNYGTVATVPAAWSLSGNTTYVVELRYRVLDPGSDPRTLFLWLQPEGTTDPLLSVTLGAPLENAPASGTFSAGAQTAGAASWVLNVSATADSRVIVDDVRVFRKDTRSSGTPPAAWSALSALPFPRLGNYVLGSTRSIAQFAPAEGVPLTYSVNQVEARLAMSDVIFGLDITNQTLEPDSVRRIRQLNPNAVILPYRISQEQDANRPPAYGQGIDLEHQLLQGLADSWYVRDTQGSYVQDPLWSLRKMNISPFCPVVGGHTYSSFLLDWLGQKVFPSGLWDGLFLDNLFGRTNPHILNGADPARLDYDWNRNGVRDETPARSSEMNRTAAGQFLRQLQAGTGGLQLLIGNAGPIPELPLAPHVNGYVFECFNENYDTRFRPWNSPGEWRATLEAYASIESAVRAPALNVLEGCGHGPVITPDREYLAPTPGDIRAHRFGLGTALLGNGFYEYDLFDARSAPYWFDEYSVDATGAAVEDREARGYLGQPLGGATELTDGGALVFQEGFESGSLPPTFQASPPGAVSVTAVPAEVITGKGSLVVANSDHTVSSWQAATVALPLTAEAHLLVFDWRVLESVDGVLRVDCLDGQGSRLDDRVVRGVVAADAGTAAFPVFPASPAGSTIRFILEGGGGKLAIDNVRVYRGRVGSWRRDFENGFVLVNPLPEARTFSAAELAGRFGRTGIRRIKGTQAPDVNSGQPVAGSLAVGAFDAIVLLASSVCPSITLSPGALPDGTVGVAYPPTAITASGGTAPYAFTVSGLPPGMTPAGPVAGPSVTIGGTPSATGPGTITVSGADAHACPFTRSYPLAICASRPSASITTVDPVCPLSFGNTASVPDAGAGASYAWTIANGAVTTGAGASAIDYRAGPSGAVSLGVTVTATPGCGASGSRSVTIDPAAGCASPVGFFPVTPCRVADTRGAPGPAGGPALVAGASRAFAVGGLCGVPATAKAVSLNVTVTQPTNPGYLALYPGGASRPLASTVNFAAGQTRANNAIVLLGALGEVTVFSGQAAGAAHFVLDVSGYFE